MNSPVFDRDELPHSANSHAFHGHEHGGVDVSFFIIHRPPGDGPALHRHPYAEVFVVEEGEVTFTVGDEQLTAHGGQIVVAPANVPHAFNNTGAGELRMLGIHPVAEMETEWLE